MNKAIIIKNYDSPISDSYFYDVRIWTRIEGRYFYCGNGKFCKTIEQVRNFCNEYNVPENRREWTVMDRDRHGFSWAILCPDRLAEEIIHRDTNWFNFNDCDFYWSENCERFMVYKEGNTISLYEA